MTPMIAEAVGTFVLITLGHAVNANISLKGTYGQSSGWIVMSIGWGLAVFCGVVVAGPYSGAHLNPAVTIGLAVAGLFPWSEVLLFCLAQLLGAMLGACLVWLNFKNHFDAEENSGTKLDVFSTRPAIKDFLINFICEATGAFMLLLVIFYITGPNIAIDGVTNGKIGLGSVGALPVAFLIIVIGLGLGGTTGYAINPARDLGPRIMHAVLPIKGKGDSNWGYAWLPIIAPIIGGSLAAGLYLLLN